MLITLVKDYGMAGANEELSDEFTEYEYKIGDKGIVEKIFELTKDQELANALYIWSINAKEDEYKGFFKRGCYSGEVEIISL